MTWLLCLHLVVCHLHALAAKYNEAIVQIDSRYTLETVLKARPGTKLLGKYTVGKCELAAIQYPESSTVSRDPITRTEEEKEKNVNIAPNGRVRAFADCYKQKTGKKYWGLTRISHKDKPQYKEDDSYMFNDPGQCVDIYVMDTGVNVNHETFGGRAYTGFTVEELRKKEGSGDEQGHGTHVAGLAAGSIHGAGKHAHIISVKVLGQDRNGSVGWVIAGLDWIQKRIQRTTYRNVTSVINMSLGIPDPDKSYEYMDACFGDVPAIIVAAAGNENVYACDVAPASFSSVITVGAVNIDNNMLHFTPTQGSNFGACVDILAPGEDIMSAANTGPTDEKLLSGTSMAAGFVSGVVARYMQPSVSDMRKLLQQTATQGVTNAPQKYTTDLLVYAGCEWGPVVTGLTKNSSSDPSKCFPYLLPSQPVAPPFIANFFMENFSNSTLIIIGIAVGAGIVGVLVILFETIVRSRRSGKIHEDQERLMAVKAARRHLKVVPVTLNATRKKAWSAATSHLHPTGQAPKIIHAPIQQQQLSPRTSPHPQQNLSPRTSPLSQRNSSPLSTLPQNSIQLSTISQRSSGVSAISKNSYVSTHQQQQSVAPMALARPQQNPSNISPRSRHSSISGAQTIQTATPSSYDPQKSAPVTPIHSAPGSPRPQHSAPVSPVQKQNPATHRSYQRHQF